MSRTRNLLFSCATLCVLPFSMAQAQSTHQSAPASATPRPTVATQQNTLYNCPGYGLYVFTKTVGYNPAAEAFDRFLAEPSAFDPCERFQSVMRHRGETHEQQMLSNFK